MKGWVILLALFGWIGFHFCATPFLISGATALPATKNGLGVVRWDSTTLTRVSPPDSSGFYPRMIQLKNGTLLTAYASRGNIIFTKSADEGKSWTAPKIVAAMRDAVNMDTPDLLQLQNGNILLCYATRPQGALRGRPDPAKKFEIRIQQSGNGEEWHSEQIIYTAGASFGDGCWEPSMVQLPSGEVQLFFANEGIYTDSKEQNISMLRSLDNGQRWTANPQIISFRSISRDGMPVPLWLKNENRVVVAIEDPGFQNFKPYILQSEKGGNWKVVISGESNRRWYALKNKMGDSIYAGAPYLRQLSTGETILSYQSTEGRLKNRDNNAVMQVAVGDAQARNFEPVSTPFPVTEGFYALWGSLCVLKDDTIIAVTSTNGVSKRRPEIWMIKGRYIRAAR